MGAAVYKLVFKSGSDGFDPNSVESLNDLPCKKLNGQPTTIGELTSNKKLYMIVNVASK